MTEPASPPPAPVLTVASPPLAVLPAPPAAPTSPSESGTCGKEGLGRVAEAARRGTVRITTHTSWGAGFLLDDTHVVTHASLVERPFKLRVHARDNLSIGAKVVFIDAFERIAILELDAPIPGRALELATSAPVIGSEAVAIGISVDFGTREERFPAHRRGVVSDRDDDLLSLDFIVGTNHIGGPLLDCQGHVIGIIVPSPLVRVGEAPMSHAVPVGKIREASASVGKKPYQSKPGMNLGFETAFASQFERGRGFVGGTLGISILFADQWEFVPRFGAFAEVSPKGDINLPLGRTDTARLVGDVRIGYRIPLVSAPATVSLVPSIGAGWNWELTQEKTYSLELENPTCMNQTAPCSFRMIENQQESWKRADVLFVGLGVHVNVLTLGYELRVVPSPDVKFIHQLSLGIATY
ncbi:trypsin-like peptidase domain-containing protein [Polyangium sp. y55x31]|uniref:trypsin-like peptidase domain-containing protein n=1 Tax=Polyangium sp. y55x31 TaxID=3042688 RepID=UPI002482BD09|nr:trypsin-like peptidase domain-containing protein [Polyangium sp. y55x31]MDI1479573.1 trypsin-like peptidase domain-containing protein [Polyangium sp. y55x31]